MNAAAWERAKSLLAEAADLPADDRARFIVEHCSDPEMRREVLDMLSSPAPLSEIITAGALASGDRIGPYVIGRLLGAGGMGEVYRALDTRLGRDVALKILPDTFVDRTDRLARMEREARVLATLNHPHIAAIYGTEDADELPGSPDRRGLALVLELVEGATLADRLASGALPLGEALQYASEIADALEAAHAKHIVHRDLKPSNIKIAPSGSIKVLDFGLAKAVAHGEQTSHTESSLTKNAPVLCGTPPYTSPEQARGLPVDERTDIWAYGCILYEMLTGVRAFRGGSEIEVLAAVIGREVDFTALPRRTPRLVRSVIQQCLQKDRAIRGGDISLIRRDIDRARQGTPPRRRFVVATAVGTVLVASVTWTAVESTRRSIRTARVASLGAPDIAAFAALKPEQLTTTKGFDGFPTYAPDGNSIAYSSDRSGALQIFVQGTSPGSTAVQLTDEGQNIEPVWSPDGQFIAYDDLAGNGIWVVPSRGGRRRRIADVGSHPTWSPDGRHIAFQLSPPNDLSTVGITSSLSTIWVADADGQTSPRQVTEAGDPLGPHTVPAWTPDGQRIVFASDVADAGGTARTTLWSVDALGGPPKLLLTHDGLTRYFALTPNGRGLFVRVSSAIWWTALSESAEASGELQPTGLASTGAAYLAVSPDDRHLSWTSWDVTGNIWAVPLNASFSASQEPAPLTDIANARNTSPALSSDGRLAFATLRPGAPSVLFLLTPGAAPRQVTTDPGSHELPTWMPGDREIAVVADHGNGPTAFFALDPNTGHERLLFPQSAIPSRLADSTVYRGAGGPIVSAFSPDFKRLAVSFVHDGVPNVWASSITAAGPDPRFFQLTHEKQSGAFAQWSPDGKWLAYQCDVGTNTHVCVTSTADGKRTQLTNEEGLSWVSGWLDDDKILLTVLRNAVWNVAWVSRSTKEMRTLTHLSQPRSFVRYARWDRVNGRVVFEHSDITGRAWTVQLPSRR